jgi:amino acid adenylation domain-containing protein
LTGSLENRETPSPGKRAGGSAADVQLAHDLITRHALLRPDARALSDGTRTLTYRQLAETASRLARRLRSLGVEPDAAVAVLAWRSIDLIVALLAVMRAGAAYVPLEPSFPDDQIALVLADAAPRALLTQSAHARRSASFGLPVAEIGAAAAHDLADDDGRPPPHGLAYIMPTSGSTGRPKGVMVSHSNLVYATQARDLVYADRPERMLLLSSTVSDSSLGDSVWTLASGGELFVAPPGLEHDLRALATFIERHRITHVVLVPALYGLLLAETEPVQLASLRTVVVYGEAWPPELARRHGAALPHTAFYSEWGPTECSVWSSYCDAQAATVEHPLGDPIAGATIFVLDADLNPVPPGMVGEACVGGPGVSRGYLGRPGQTARSYVPDPWSAQPGARMYRTGDLVRRDQTGELQFLGRLDNQVKVRGFRIELEEVEFALSAVPGVRQAAVRAIGQDASRRLAAYLVPEVYRQRPSESELRESLSQRLPSHMIPSVWTWLESLPMTAAGKLDRTWLEADHQQHQPESSRRDQHLSSPIERRVADVWQEVLGVAAVSASDDFFLLGGQSLFAMQVVARLDKAFGIDLAVRALFETPTVPGLANTIEKLLVDKVRHMSDAEARRLIRELDNTSTP